MVPKLKNFINILKNDYFSFKGRLSRKQFAIRFLVIQVLLIILTIFMLATAMALGSKLIFLLLFIIIPLYLFSYAPVNQRFHDIGKGDMWTLVAAISGLAIPIIQLVFLIYLFTQKGQVGPNQYGDDPLNKE